jgi:type II secretory pathway component PulC
LIGAQPHYEGGRFVGFRASLTEATDFTRTIRLEPDDIITGVNGISFQGEDHAIALLKGLSGYGQLTFTVWRNGHTLALN